MNVLCRNFILSDFCQICSSFLFFSSSICRYPNIYYRATISNDTLIIVRFSIKVDKHPYGGISPLIFP